MLGKTKQSINIAKVAFSYMGAVVGAGFTSGQELMQFFVALKAQKTAALLLVTVLFMVFGWATLYLNRKYRCKNYSSFLQCLLGNRIARLFDLLLGFFLFSGVGIMLSATGALFAEHLALPFSLGVSLLALTIIVVLAKEVQGILWINTILMPFKFIIIILVSVLIVANVSPTHSFLGDYASGFEPVVYPWWLAGIVYVSYNLLLGLAVLVSLGETGWGPGLGRAGLWGGLGLGIFAGAIVLALNGYWPVVTQYQVPMVYLAAQVHPGIKILYISVLGMGMVTTGVSCAHTLTTRLAHSLRFPYFPILCLTAVVAIPLAQMGFGRLVRLIYPLFGYAGLILLIGLTWRTIEALGEYRIQR